MTLFFGYLGCLLLVAAFAAWCAGRSRFRMAIALGSAAVLFVPVGELLAVEYLRAAIGDLSIVTQVLLAAFVLGHTPDRRQLAPIMAVALAGAVFLYPAALGVTVFDSYALGYASVPFIAVLAGLTLAAWYLRFEWLAACLLVAAAAKVAGVLESRNLWDYLVDPLLVLYAAFWLCRRALQMRRASAAAPSTP
jgi:hypothetical protein